MHPEAAEALVTECRRLVRRKSRGGVRGHTGWHFLESRSLLRPSVQAWPESDTSLHPEVGPVQHLLPQRDLLPRPVHPGNRATEVAAGTKVEPDRVEKLTFAIHGNDFDKSKELVERNTDLAPPRKSWVLPIRSWSQIASSKLLSITWRHHCHPHIFMIVRHQEFFNDIMSNCL